MTVEFALGALFAVVAWWVATGVILYLDGLPTRTYGTSMAGATLVVAAGIAGVASCSDRQTVASAYCAFASTIAIWGWVELSFLTGFITGPTHGTPRKRFSTTNLSSSALRHCLP
jgi:putative photosynthetic complex assembly protein 2